MATVSEAVKIARAAFNRNVSKDVNWRKEQLRGLLRLLNENADAIHEAINSDFRRSKYESLAMELTAASHEVAYQLENIDEFVKPVPVPRKGFTEKGDDPFLKYEPYGVCLIIGAWNGPVGLLFSPLAGCIAAGNVAILKPSELDQRTEQIIVDLIPKYLDRECFHVFTGGPAETTVILKERFDFIFFTGSPMVGRIVHQAAAQHLTPVCLELGGKSPVFIDDTVPNFEIAMRRLFWAKFFNGGQGCVLPDYVMTTSPKVQEKIVHYARKIIKEFFGDNPKDSDSLAQIVNERNAERLGNLITTSTGKIEIGGSFDIKSRYVEPTVITNVSPNDLIMKDEIFGPILPIMIVKSVDEAIEHIKSDEKPLAMYLFTTNKKIIDRFLEETSAGSVCVNDAILQMTVEGMPFGGVGQSGLGGQYHGRFSFDLFSYRKPVLIRTYDLEVENELKDRYPPHTEEKARAFAEASRREV